MKAGVRVVVITVGVLLLTLGVFAVPTSWGASNEGTASTSGGDELAHTLAPRSARAISIPFGVENTLTLSSDGRTIQVVGHAECPEEMARFTVQAVAVQDAPGTYGTSPFTEEFTCQTGEQAWEAEITPQDTSTFVEGDAWVCVTALFFAPYTESGVFRWCYEEVILESAPPQEEARVLFPLVTSTLIERVAELWSLLPWGQRHGID